MRMCDLVFWKILLSISILCPNLSAAQSTQNTFRSKDQAIAKVSELYLYTPLINQYSYSALEWIQNSQQVDKRIKDTLAKDYTVEALNRRLTVNLETQLNAADLKTSLQWLLSNKGKKIIELEKAFRDPMLPIKAKRWANKIAKPDILRIRQIRAWLKITQRPKFNFELYEMAETQIIKASWKNNNGPTDITEDQLEYVIIEKLSPYKKQLEKQHLVDALYVYKSLSDKELEEYLKFLMTKPSLVTRETYYRTIRKIIKKSQNI